MTPHQHAIFTRGISPSLFKRPQICKTTWDNVPKDLTPKNRCLEINNKTQKIEHFSWKIPLTHIHLWSAVGDQYQIRRILISVTGNRWSAPKLVIGAPLLICEFLIRLLFRRLLRFLLKTSPQAFLRNFSSDSSLSFPQDFSFRLRLTSQNFLRVLLKTSFKNFSSIYPQDFFLRLPFRIFHRLYHIYVAWNNFFIIYSLVASLSLITVWIATLYVSTN